MSPETVQALNRLLAILCRSFPQYLQYSRPHVPKGRDDVLESIEAMVTDQNTISDRINRLLSDSGSRRRTGDFPMEFTDLHDLSIDFLLKYAANYQEQDIAKIDEIVQQLRTAPAAKAIAEEALGMAKGHLDSLRDLTLAPAS
ncbi:MAG: hypothetical protein RH917_12905 [Lacipirellulaceae bacterium]